MPTIGERLWDIAARFGAIGDRPEDSEDDRQRHRFMLITGVSMSLGGVIWGTLSIAAGLYAHSLIPYGYTVVTIINFAVLSRGRNFAAARTVQILISLLLPFLFQWSLGGFVASGAMMIWAMLALVCALSFESKRAAVMWLGLYLGLTVVSGFLDPTLARPPQLPEGGLGPFSFAINIATVSATVFVLTIYFLHRRDLANEELRRKNEQIARSQQALVQSEKMAALGQLVAGVAHELNTPLGAIVGSVGNIGAALERTLDELPEVLVASTPEEVAGLRAIVRAGGEGNHAVTSREERELRGLLEAELTARQVPDAGRLARALVSMGTGAEIEPHLPLLRSPRAPALVRSAGGLTSMRRNSATIKTAAERASKIVFALKSFAHPGTVSGEPVTAKLADNLETVLTLYQNQIKNGVVLVRTFEDPCLVRGHHDELNQVWTNLVHNALQAMQYKGRLELRLAREPRGVIVQVIDSGPGIPAEALSRIFEPFYTTKPQGEGSGLGLSISRDIVERHHGRLSAESQPGRTVFTVSLPDEAAATIP